MVSTDRRKQETRVLNWAGLRAVRLLAALATVACVAIPASGDAQLTSQEQKCIGALTKDGGKLSKTESKLQQKCMKDGANGKLTGMVDQCVADDEKGKIAKTEAKTLADELKHCTEGSGFVSASGAQTNLSGKVQALELARDLFGSTLHTALQGDKANAKCQQKVQKSLDKVLATKIKSYTKCAKLVARDPATLSIAPFENCLIAVATDEKVAKAVAKLADARAKSCDSLPLDTIFPGNCDLVDPVQFDACADALAECRACTTIAGMNGLATDCDLFDDGVDNDSCADSAPTCGDGNVDGGEECDPGAQPICCSATCVNNADGLSCDDGTFCNGADTCSMGACVSPGDPCAGGSECNVSCNEATDDCFDPAATACTDDGNVCTDDSCDGAGTCAHPNNTDSCDDNDACTTVDVCGGGTCNGSVPPNCNDSNICTDDICDSGLGCQNINNTVSCDDGVFCNGVDTCGGGTCNSSGDPCIGGAECNVTCNESTDDCFDPQFTPCTDDGNPCTDDYCDISGACVHVNNTAGCDDGDACTTGDICGGGTCNGGAPPNCDDGNVCTDDSCDSGLGCQNVNNTVSCDDGLFCNGTDTCGGGTCNSTGDPCAAGGECNDFCDEGADTCTDPITTPCTDDGNVCTGDVCDGLGACVHPDNTDPCDDGDACTTGDTCGGGTCNGGAPPNCDDSNVCTDDSCDSGLGCLNVNNTASCDDGDACTTADTCGGGTCNGGAPPNCDDSNVCTDDSCDSGLGCLNVNNAAPCSDGLFCNGADTCSGGSCSVNAGDPCTGPDGDGDCAESCDEGADNCLAPDPVSACTDGLFCNGTETCDGAGTCGSSTGDPCTGPDGDGDCKESCDEGADNCLGPDPVSACTDGIFCNGTETCNGSGTCGSSTGNPCPGADGDGNCAESCNEGADNCLAADPNGSACDNGVAGPNDNCDVTGDTCSGGTCVNSDPAQVPEQCYTVGDEDCDGFADTADTDPDSQCQANGIQTCTCADACLVGRVVPAPSGGTSLGGLTALTGEGFVTTSISSTAGTGYGTDTGTSYTHTLSGVPANLSLWLGFTGNAGHNDDFAGSPNVSQFRFAASDTNALSGGDFISEGPQTTVGGTGSTLTEGWRTDGLPIQGGVVGNACSTNTSTSLEIQRTSGPGTNWTAWGIPFPTSAMSAALQTEQSSTLTGTRLMPITGNGSLITRVRLQLGNAAIQPQFDAASCHTSAFTNGFGINMTAAIYGSYRNANVCP